MEDYEEDEAKAAIWELIDEKQIEQINLSSNRFAAATITEEARKKILDILRKNGPAKIKELVGVAGSEKKQVLYRRVIRDLLDSGKINVTMDWKVSAS